VLNTFSSGLGNSRATDASAKFSMTNGVIYSDSLEIRSTMMQLEYMGTVDLGQNVNARVTARLLRDTWVVGPLVSTVLWPVSKLFEYKITGTLKNPKSEPVYVPKLLLLPLHPIRTLEGMFPGGETETNAPPEN
jgi:autotransporter translocation and assembly factor TamB